MGYPANSLPTAFKNYVERTQQLIREFWVGVDLLALELRRRYRLECEEVVGLVKLLIPTEVARDSGMISPTIPI